MNAITAKPRTDEPRLLCTAWKMVVLFYLNKPKERKKRKKERKQTDRQVGREEGTEMGMEDRPKARKCRSGGRRSPPVGSRGRVPGRGQGAKCPEAEGFFQNLRYEKPNFLALYPVSHSNSQNTLYSDSRLSSSGTNQA